MVETSRSLLERLRDCGDEAAWQRLSTLYTPFIRGWLRRQGVDEHDADDLVQEVLAVLVRELPKFQHDQRAGAFRSWLRLITVHRLRNFWRARQNRPAPAGDLGDLLDQLAEHNSALSKQWDQEHDRHVLARLLAAAEPDFAPATWQAFRRQVIDGLTAAAAASELGLTVNAVLIAKSRVLRRLRGEARGLVD